MNQIPALIRVFSYLSVLTVGGGMAAFPEMKILTVDVHHWLNFAHLIHLYSVGQMAPGPNMMMIVSIGLWAGGTLGANRCADSLFRAYGHTSVCRCQSVEKAGEVAMENLYSTGSCAVCPLGCCWPVVQPGKGCNRRRVNRRARCCRPADTAAVQGQSSSTRVGQRRRGTADPAKGDRRCGQHDLLPPSRTESASRMEHPE